MAGIHTDFLQQGPQLTNSYSSDSLLRHFLRWQLPEVTLREIEPGLERFGGRCVTDIQAWADEAEAHPPRLVSFSAWGERRDEIEMNPAWARLQEMAAEEGLIAIGYERKHGAVSRVHQFAKLYMVHPSSAFFTCPLAMTDGAARVIELSGTDKLKEKAFKNLTSREPAKFWTSGQWMTEKTGGSDVSGTSTVARKEGAGFRLYGDKWFTSSTTSPMAMALGKVEGAGDSRQGLSLFYVETHKADGSLNSIRINRLKDKLGTKALPTAELSLEGVPAVMVGEIGEGVKRVSALLNITRLYNSACALGTMARAVNLAKDYAKRREAFGLALSAQPLHLQTLANMQVDYEAVFHLTFHLVQLLGKDETGTATPGETAVLRLMTPVIKLWSAKQCMSLVSEMVESFGGAGYVEDTGLPRLLRDAQVFSIWEGTTNVLSLDALRAIAKEQALAPFFEQVIARLGKVKHRGLQTEVTLVEAALDQLKGYFKMISASSSDVQQAAARAFAFGLARVASASLLLEFAEWCLANKVRPESEDVARRFCHRPLVELPALEHCDPGLLKRIVYG